jgi:uncharacterized damage-inducible protein DinB
VTSALLGPLSYDTWATLRLIEFVRDQPSDRRTWTVPGTYGSIEQTLGHIVGSEHYYVYRLTGEAPTVELKAAPTVDLGDLVERVQWCAERLERFYAKGFDEDAPAHKNPRDSPSPTLGDIVTRLIWHGTEHRSQIATILGAHGVDVPDMCRWTSQARDPRWVRISRRWADDEHAVSRA